MVKEVFNRYENKYLIDNDTFEKIKKELNTYMMFDEFNKDNKVYTVHTIYLDTIDNNYIRTSLSKPKYKEKVRIRSYEEIEHSEFVFLEIKKKYNQLGNKRRTKLKLDEALAFIETGNIPEYKGYMNKQVVDELGYILNKDKLYLKTNISYDRIAYFNKDGHDLRITFDTNVISQRIGQEKISLLEENKWIMEIKAERSYPVWITKVLSKYKVESTSFSKYGKEYEMMLKQSIINSKNNTIAYKSILEKTQKGKENYYGINFKHEYC